MVSSSPQSSHVQITRPRKPPAFLNRVIVGLLRSPVHGILSKNVMALTFTGRKSGRQFTTPVTYSSDGERIVVFSSNPWWKNLRNGEAVIMDIKGQRVQGIAQATEDREVVLREVQRYLAKKGVRSARMIGLQLPSADIPTLAELDVATQGRAVVLIQLRTNT